jgi:hypothetical protein
MHWSTTRRLLPQQRCLLAHQTTGRQAAAALKQFGLLQAAVEHLHARRVLRMACRKRCSRGAQHRAQHSTDVIVEVGQTLTSVQKLASPHASVHKSHHTFSEVQLHHCIKRNRHAAVCSL